MKTAMDVAEATTGDVRVDLGGTDVCVAEHFLDDPQVSAMLQQVCGEAVPEHVRGHIFGDAGSFDPLLDAPP